MNNILLSIIPEKNNLEEIGLCYIGALLRDNGYNVSMLSNSDPDVIYERIEKIKPDMVGFTVYNMNYFQTLEISRKIKSNFPRILICLGGRKATDASLEILDECEEIDYIITGEGEYPMLELLNALKQDTPVAHIKNLTYRKNGKPVRNEDRTTLEDLDELPFAIRDILMNERINTANIISSRGCTQRCSFCASSTFWRPDKKSMQWRGRNPDLVIKEIRQIQSRLGTKFFKFLDCSFEDPDQQLKRSTELANKLLESKIDMAYMVQFRPDIYKKARNNGQYMQTLIDSGLSSVFIGVESGNDADLKLYNKGCHVEDNCKCVEYLSQHGILVKFGFIAINPFSTLESLRQNVNFLHRFGWASGLDMTRQYQVNINTALYNKIEESGLGFINRDEKIHEYRFIDLRVKQIIDCARKYYTDIFDPHKLFVLKYFIEIFDEKIVFLRTYYKTRNPALYANIQTAYLQYLKIMDILNKKNYTWFHAVIDLAEIGWNDLEAKNIMNEIISPKFLIQIYASFLNLQKKLCKDIQKVDKRDAEYLLSI